MYGTRPTQLITGGFVGHEPDEFQNPSHRHHETNGLEVNAGQWSPLVEPLVVFYPTTFEEYPKPANREEDCAKQAWERGITSMT